MSSLLCAPLLLLIAAVSLAMALSQPLPGMEPAEPAPQPSDSTWHIVFNELFERDAKKNEARNLDFYATFSGGSFRRGVGTARRYNTSAHLVESAELKLLGNKLSGRLTLIITPDAWVPANGQPQRFESTVEVSVRQEGENYVLTGSYSGTLDSKKVSGQLSGALGHTETDWGDSVWSVSLTPSLPPISGMQPNIDISVGIADGQVHWANIGRSFKGARPRVYSWDASNLSVDDGTVRGQMSLPARAVDLTADPKATADISLRIDRVQGMVVGHATVSLAGDTFEAYGRGGGQRGGGAGNPEAPTPLWRYSLDTNPWWLPVADFTPPQAGEHPRLFFRRSQLPALRAKAQSPEGKAILARLRLLLDGAEGKTLPTNKRSPDLPHGDDSESIEQALGTLSMGHMAGYGLLYQLTGEQHYADMAKQCTQWFFEGYRDRDGKARYSFREPSGALRAGPVLGWLAVGYDLCYDGWDEDFRQQVAREILNYDEGGKSNLAGLAAGSMIPGSNHYGMQVGGAVLAALAIAGDPGVDMQRLTPILVRAERASIHLLSQAFGDAGFFAEGDGTGSMASHIAFLPALQAWQNAAGKDFISARPQPSWMSLKWIMASLVNAQGRIEYPANGGYSGNIWDRDGLSGAGYFAYGFGTVRKELQPAMLGFYERFLKTHDQAKAAPFDTLSVYPQVAVLSFINWPLEVQAADPAKILGHTSVDTTFGYMVNRNRWQDQHDIVITTLLNTGPQGYIRVAEDGQITLWGLGVRSSLRTRMNHASPVYYASSDKGSSVLSVWRSGYSSLAIDLSGSSGVPALIVATGPAFENRKPRLRAHKKVGQASAALQEITAGSRIYFVSSIHEGDAPKVEVEGEGIRIGKQSIHFDGQTLVLADF